MSAFFESEIIKEELGVINKLQEEVYGKLIHFHMMTHDEQLDHISKLSELLDKQRVMYARLSLSDDPEAQEMKKRIVESASMMGLPSSIDMTSLFDNMSQAVEMMRKQIDKDL